MISNPPPAVVISGLPLLNPYVGVGVYTLRLIRGLARSAQLPFLVLLPREAEDSIALLPEQTFRLLPRRAPKLLPRRFKEIWWMQKIASIARRDYPEAVFHSPGPFWASSAPRRSVVTLHDCIYRRFPFYLGRYFIGKWLAYAAERFAAAARMVLTVSQSAAADLRELAGIPAEKIRVIYQWVEERFNPVDARQAAPAVRAKYGLPESFFLYVGGYDYRKNVEFLLQAYADARRAQPLWPLVLAGRVPTQRHRTLCDVNGALARLGLGPQDVLMPGLIDDADMPGLYGAARLLVFPSLHEGFGYPPIEAIASGVPVLVADNSSLREVVSSVRNRFETANTGELAALLREAMQNPSQFVCEPDARFREQTAIPQYIDAIRSAA